MDAFIADLRQSWRGLARRPFFVAAVVLVLALGLGTNALIFGLLDAVVLRPLPIPDDHELVEPWRDFSWLTKEEFVFLRENLEGAETAGYFAWPSFAVRDGESSEIFRGSMVTANYFEVLDVQPALGRFFSPESERPGASTEVLISYRSWQSRYGGEESVLGRELIVDGEPATIIGVVPRGLGLPRATADMWLPLTFDPSHREDYAARYVQWIARRGDNTSAGAFAAESQALAARFGERFDHGDSFAERTGGAHTLRDSLVGESRPMLMALFLAAAAVLLVVTVNVANLLLARGASRSREFAVRAAIGADRRRLLRLLSTEGLMLSLAGGAIGTAGAYWGLGKLPVFLPWSMRHARVIEPDMSLLAVGLVIALVTGVLFGALPGLKLLRADLASSLRAGTSGGLGRSRLHGVLVIAEVALAFVLVTSAGLVARSMLNIIEVEPGFDSSRLVTLRPYYPDEYFADRDRLAQLHHRYEQRIASVPSVLAVGSVNQVPMIQTGFTGTFSLEGREYAEGEAPIVNFRAVTPGYFDALGMQILRGRGLGEMDRWQGSMAVVVNQAFVEEHLQGEVALGRRLAHSSEGVAEEGKRWAEIVGVVSDIHQNNLMEAPLPEIYRPLDQVDRAVGMAFMVRVAGDPAAALMTVQQAASEVAPEIPISDLRTMTTVVARSSLFQRLTAVVFGAFAALALMLAAAGIYAVVAYEASQRTREMGLRLALGAEPGNIVKLVLSQTGRRAAVGLVLGLGLAAITSRYTASLLFGLEPFDPLVLAIAFLALAGSSLVAALRPALRASRVDPLVALRED